MLLLAQGGMEMDAARRFFGKLLSQYALQPRDLLGAIGEARANCTSDPKSWLTAAARSRSQRRQTGPPKRVGWV